MRQHAVTKTPEHCQPCDALQPSNTEEEEIPVNLSQVKYFEFKKNVCAHNVTTMPEVYVSPQS